MEYKRGDYMNLERSLNKQLSLNKENIFSFLNNNNIEDINIINPPVSFDEDDNAISYWKDEKWDFSNNSKVYKLYNNILDLSFYSNLENKLFHELKYLLLVCIYSDYKKYTNANQIKIKAKSIHFFLEACQNMKFKTILELNSDVNFISLMESIKGKYSFSTLSFKLSDLAYINSLYLNNFHLNINLRKNVKSFKIKDLAKKYSTNMDDSYNQTLYIPINIHSKIIDNCIKLIENNKDRLGDMLDFIEKDYLLYQNITEKFDIKNPSSKESNAIINNQKKWHSMKLFKKYNFPFINHRELQNEIKLIATACSVILMSFTGMRINELANIKVDGFKVIERADPKLFIIRSFETKISGGQNVDYITSPISKDAIETINRIHSIARKYDKSIVSDDLFITSKHQKLLTYGRTDSIMSNIRELPEIFNIKITEEDLKESERVNGIKEEIKKDQYWPLTSHQFRRTLIINFVSHRLGSITAVKQQVKHMYATMTEYYAKNSQLAETFDLKVVKEISDNIEDEVLNEAVSIYKKFYYSDETLDGIKGKEIMIERKFSKVLSDDEIKQLFKTGLYKISRSLYGYCTKGNLCDKKESIDPTFCGAACNTMVITKENALNWEKLYNRNKRMLHLKDELIISGIPLNAAKTTMISQNEIAKRIMNSFDIIYKE